MKLRPFLTGGALLSVFILSASSLQAGWRHLRGGGSSGAYASYGSSGASYGSSGASYGSSGASSGYYSVSYGSSGYGSSGASYGSSGIASSGGSSGYPGLGWRIRAHMDAKRARRAAYASSGHSSGSYVSYSSSGGSSGTTYRTSYGSHGSSGTAVSYGSSGTISHYTVRATTAPVHTVASASQSDSIHLTVAVPSKAKIFVNGNATTSQGAVREFVSRGLTPGKTYTFKVRAELEAVDGQTLVESKDVVLTAGSARNLQFAFADQRKAIETALTLNVPEGAKVTLAGNSTKAIGGTRTYRTKSMTPGEIWDDYEVKVSLGDQVKTQSIRLIAGDQLQLTFDFAKESADKLASR